MNVPHKNWNPAESEMDAIARRHGTDKSSNGTHAHGYTKFYEQHMAARRNDPLSILEIGVGGGHSIGLWEGYFPSATVTMLEINPEKTRYATSRTRIFIGDSGTPEGLSALPDIGFDFIIDDGGHRECDVLSALDALWPRLNAGGIYFIEDLGWSTDEEAPVLSRDDAARCVSKWTSTYAQALLFRFLLFQAKELVVHPSQNRYGYGTGGQSLVVLKK